MHFICYAAGIKTGYGMFSHAIEAEILLSDNVVFVKTPDALI